MNEVNYYLGHIGKYDKEFAKWENRVTKLLKKYRDEFRGSREGEAKYNILWSMVQTLKAATFSRMPKPDVSRRFKDNDPVGRVSALILERCLDFEIQHYPDYRETLTAAVLDRFLGGRGVSWVRYEPKFKTIESLEDGYQVSEDQRMVGEGDEQEAEVIDYECAPTDYVHWRDFGHVVARTWEEVSIVWRKVYMTRAMLRERFPDIADKIPLDASPDDQKKGDTEGVDKRALIYEIWDKETGKAVWMSKSLGKILDEKDDPLELEGFFPCPKPLFATLTNETLVPVPDFTLYQDQARELDILCDRIDGLIKALQVKGVYDASVPELARLFTEGENTTMIPVKNWMAFAEKQGLRGAIDLVDVAPIAQALMIAYQAMDQVKSQIYDITGISDIIRGQSQASETATAQQIKGQYASLRLKAYQDDVARFASQMIQLKAQIICKHFSHETILSMACVDQFNEADKQYIMPAIDLLRNDPLRNFRIDIVADSMILMDEKEEKEGRVEFLTAISGFLEKSLPVAQSNPDVAPVLAEFLKFGTAAFRAGKSVEGVIDQFADQVREKAANPQPPQPDPEQIKAEGQMQLEQARMQMDQQKAQTDLQLEQYRIEQDRLRSEMEAQREAQKIQLDMQLEQYKAEMQKQIESDRLNFERWKTEIQEKTKLAIAQMNQQSAIDSGAEKQVSGVKDEMLGNIAEMVNGMVEQFSSALENQRQITEGIMNAVNSPREVVYDSNGRAIGVRINGTVREIKRGQDGTVLGV